MSNTQDDTQPTISVSKLREVCENLVRDTDDRWSSHFQLGRRGALADLFFILTQKNLTQNGSHSQNRHQSDKMAHTRNS